MPWEPPDPATAAADAQSIAAAWDRLARRETAAEGRLERARGARFDRTEAANDVEVLRTVVMSAEREDMGAIQNLDTSLAGE